LNRSPSVHLVPISDESDVDESYNDTSDQSLPTIPINTAQEDTPTTPITNIDPYETWWNGKVSLYRFLRNALKDHLWSNSKQHEALSTVDLIDDEIHRLSTVTHGSLSNSTENVLSTSPSLDDLLFVLSPRVLATILYNQLIGCCCCLPRKFSILLQRFNTSHVSIPQETKQPKFFKVPMSLDFERMYVGFAVLFILHYFYLLRIVLSRNSRSEQFSRNHRKQGELRFTLDAVVEEEEEEEEEDDDDDYESDSEKEWEHHGVHKERCEEQFEDLVGRELVVVHSRPLVSSSPFRSRKCTSAQKLSSVTTATTIEAFSFSEDSDDEQQDDSESSSSEHTFPSQFAAVDWYYYQQEVQGPQPINKECQVILR